MFGKVRHSDKKPRVKIPESGQTGLNVGNSVVVRRDRAVLSMIFETSNHLTAFVNRK